MKKKQQVAIAALDEAIDIAQRAEPSAAHGVLECWAIPAMKNVRAYLKGEIDARALASRSGLHWRGCGGGWRR